MTVSNEQILLNEINTRIKQYIKEHTQENDQSDEEYYHDFLYQNAGYIDGLYSVLSLVAMIWPAGENMYVQQLTIIKIKINLRKHKLLFHINQIMKIVLFLFISAGVAAVIISAISAAIRHIKLLCGRYYKYCQHKSWQYL